MKGEILLFFREETGVRSSLYRRKEALQADLNKSKGSRGLIKAIKIDDEIFTQ